MNKYIICLCAGHFLAFVDRFLTSAALSSIKLDLALGDGALGALIGPAFALSYILGGIVYVTLKLPPGDRAIKSGILLWTIGECVCALAPSGLVFAIGQAAIGIGQAIFIPSALRAVVVTDIDMGKSVSLFTASSTLGRSAAVLCAGTLLSFFGWLHVADHVAWRLLYLLAAVSNIALILAIPTFLKPQNGDPVVIQSPSIRWLIGNGREALLIMFVTLPAILLIQAVAGWMPTLFARRFHYPSNDAATFVGMLTLLTAPAAQLFWGRRFDRWPLLARRSVASIAISTVTAGLSVVAIAFARSPAEMLGMLAVTNVLLGAASLIGLAALQLRVPPDRRAAVNTIFLALVTALGVGLGPLFVGMLSQEHGSSAAGLGSAMAIVAAGTSLCVLLLSALSKLVTARMCQ